jgi:hypothetical protein
MVCASKNAPIIQRAALLAKNASLQVWPALMQSEGSLMNAEGGRFTTKGQGGICLDRSQQHGSPAFTPASKGWYLGHPPKTDTGMDQVHSGDLGQKDGETPEDPLILRMVFPRASMGSK